MAKRFIDTNFYKHPFVKGLKGALKGLYGYIICDCDGAGIWVKDLQIASIYVGFEISEKDFNVFLEKEKAIDLKNGKYFFPDFLQHQYPKGLSIHNPAQKNFIIELQKNSLIDSDLKPLWSTLQGTKVMVMEKVEVMEKDKVITKKKLRENVFLTSKEIETLERQYSPDEINWMYDKLSAYKLSKGKNYKSDYGAIMNWVVDRLKEEKIKEKNSAKKENGKSTSKSDQTITGVNAILEKRGLAYKSDISEVHPD